MSAPGQVTPPATVVARDLTADREAPCLGRRKSPGEGLVPDPPRQTQGGGGAATIHTRAGQDLDLIPLGPDLDLDPHLWIKLEKDVLLQIGILRKPLLEAEAEIATEATPAHYPHPALALAPALHLRDHQELTGKAPRNQSGNQLVSIAALAMNEAEAGPEVGVGV